MTVRMRNTTILVILCLWAVAACEVPATPTPPVPAPSDLIVNAWQDVDRNGVWGEQEPGVAGVTLAAGPLPTLTTGETGHATWSGLLAGCWSTTVTVPAGWIVIYPSNMLCLWAGDMTIYPIALEETR